MNKEYIVTIKKGSSNQRFKNIVARYGAVLNEDYRGLERMFKITLDDSKKSSLKKEREIEHVAPADAVVKFNSVQPIEVTRYGFGDNWGLGRITLGEEWNDNTWYPFNGKYEYNRTGKGVDVYVVDTGCNFNHDDFQGRATPIFDYYVSKGKAGYCVDQQGHGTHVASTIGGMKYGVAKECNLLISRVFQTGGASLAAIVSGIDACLKHHQSKRASGNKNPSIMNLSLGGPAHRTEEQIVNDCINAGMICVVAAGNDGRDLAEAGYDIMPAEVKRAITVGSHDIKDRISSFSNYGKMVDVFAPGHYICAAGKDGTNTETMLSGTSMATPHVAGACALYAEGLETTTNATHVAEVHDWIVSSSTKNTIALHARASKTSANRALIVKLEAVKPPAAPIPKPVVMVDSSSEYDIDKKVIRGTPIVTTIFVDKEQKTVQNDKSILWEMVRYFTHTTTVQITTTIVRTLVTTITYSDNTVEIKRGPETTDTVVTEEKEITHSQEVIDSRLTPAEIKETGKVVSLDKKESRETLDPVREEIRLEERTDTHTHENGDIHVIVYIDHHFKITTETVITTTTQTVSEISWSDGTKTKELGKEIITVQSEFNITNEIVSEKASETITPAPEPEPVPDTIPGYLPRRFDLYPEKTMPFRWGRLIVIVRHKATTDELEELKDLAYDIAYSGSRYTINKSFMNFREKFNIIRTRY